MTKGEPKPRIYLETTMFNFPFVEEKTRAYRQYKTDTLKVFDMIKEGIFEPYTSVYVYDEIMREPDEKSREAMVQLFNECGATILSPNDETNRLALLYVANQVVSPNYRDDALHIAATTVNGLDFIVSLNFTHIVRPWTIEKVANINTNEGYKKIGIFKPSEVIRL